MNLKKLISLLLAAVMLLGMFPTAGASEPEEAKELTTEQSDEMWAEIEAFEEKTLEKRGINEAPTAATYAAMTDEVIELVTSSSSYKKGTLEQHGDFFFWETEDGMPNAYSPSLRARMHEGYIPDADPEDFSETITDSYEDRASFNGNNSLKVAVFQPFYGIDSSFLPKYSEEGKRIARAIGGTSYTYRTSDATITKIAYALSNYGLVIFDSHGDTDYYKETSYGDDCVSKANTSYLCISTKVDITEQDAKQVSGTYGNYYHACYFGSSIYGIDGTAIANHMTKTTKKPLLWMAICLGMATKGLYLPLRNKGVEVVYGYSQSVSFDGDYIYEEYFYDHLIAGYNVASSIAYMKSKAGCKWDPAYKPYNLTAAEAKKYFIAFPIVVSSQDAYPGKGKVDAVQTPKSTWKLRNSSVVCENCPGAAFTDMPAKSNWAHAAIDWAIVNKITSGTSKTTFSPNAGCTRGQVVTFLWRAAGSPAYVPENPMTPVSLGGGTENVPEREPNQPGDVNCEHAFVGTLTEPGCTADGFITYTCTKCGALFTDDASPALGHDFQYDKTVPETGSAGCYDVYTCTRCGAQEMHTMSNHFTDVTQNNYFYDAVMWAVRKGITAGSGKTTFSPDNTCTRGQIVTFIWRYEGCPTPRTTSNPFKDVSESDYYYDAVLWASENGITAGTSKTTFSPKQTCTRAQVVTFLYRDIQ